MNKKQKGGSTSDSIANYVQKQHKKNITGKISKKSKKAFDSQVTSDTTKKQAIKKYIETNKKNITRKKKCGGSVMMCGGEYHSPISKAVGPNKVL